MRIVFSALAAILASLGLLWEIALNKPESRAESFFRRSLIESDDSLAGRAHDRLWAGRIEGPDGAVEIFQELLRRDAASPYRWCDLGEALLEAGQFDRAKGCFSRAVESGPNLPPILLRAANFHFTIGDSRQARFYAARVLRITPAYDQVIFQTYFRTGITLDEMTGRGLPAGGKEVR